MPSYCTAIIVTTTTSMSRDITWGLHGTLDDARVMAQRLANKYGAHIRICRLGCHQDRSYVDKPMCYTLATPAGQMRIGSHQFVETRVPSPSVADR